MKPNWILWLVVALAFGGCRGGGSKPVARETPTPAPDTVLGTSASDSARVKLVPGMPFPSVPLRTLEDEVVDSRSLVEGRESLVLFIDADCEACREFLDVWMERWDELPPGLNVVGIVREAPDYARDYAENSGFPFPVYCDPDRVFAEKYIIKVTPSVVGVYPDGHVAYLGKAVTTEFTPAKAVALLEELRKGKEAGGAAGR